MLFVTLLRLVLSLTLTGFAYASIHLHEHIGVWWSLWLTSFVMALFTIGGAGSRFTAIQESYAFACMKAEARLVLRLALLVAFVAEALFWALLWLYGWNQVALPIVHAVF